MIKNCVVRMRGPRCDTKMNKQINIHMLAGQINSHPYHKHSGSNSMLPENDGANEYFIGPIYSAI